ncbi:unnamed protein product [Brugia timori]|uniref:Transposase n=1 Tax=Brugia timori TaxID=42155 RepID=A0A0R3QGW5_9BILA|nr:unnamed protein product [Brugia timori]
MLEKRRGMARKPEYLPRAIENAEATWFNIIWYCFRLSIEVFDI